MLKRQWHFLCTHFLSSLLFLCILKHTIISSIIITLTLIYRQLICVRQNAKHFTKKLKRCAHFSNCTSSVAWRYTRLLIAKQPASSEMVSSILVPSSLPAQLTVFFQCARHIQINLNWELACHAHALSLSYQRIAADAFTSLNLLPWTRVRHRLCPRVSSFHLPIYFEALSLTLGMSSNFAHTANIHRLFVHCHHQSLCAPVFVLVSPLEQHQQLNSMSCSLVCAKSYRFAYLL